MAEPSGTVRRGINKSTVQLYCTVHDDRLNSSSPVAPGPPRRLIQQRRALSA
jgi:hypothetical protein